MQSGEDIQRMLLSPAARRMLRDQVRALLAPRAVLGRCHLRDVIFRPGCKLTAYLDVLVRVGTTQRYRVRPIAVIWGSATDADRGGEGGDITKLQAEAVRRGVAAPFLQLMADFPEWSMHVWVSPLDARFTQLVRVSDPRRVREMLADACASGHAGSDQRRISDYTVTAIRYRPGKRHVLRYDPVDPAKGGTLFAKLYIGENGARAFRMANRTADWLAECGESVNCLRPLAYVGEDAVVLYPRVCGTPLSGDLPCPCDRLARCLERVGAALHTLHRLPEAVAGPLEVRNFVTEIQAIAWASSHIPALLPEVGSAIEALLDRARELHARLPQEQPTFTHRDFKSEHVWVGPGGLTLIDFDRSRLADPALDVGTLLADLRWWCATYDLPGLAQAQKRFLAGYVPGAPKERLLRARLYQAIKLVKMTVIRVCTRFSTTGPPEPRTWLAALKL
ncbi:MAG: hypothetical protein DMG30_28470 [Acidobacteria bacterium]|nr:MAG: hypothetical protein DMG30_28470 [Acidobacteriota bacterium]